MLYKPNTLHSRHYMREMVSLKLQMSLELPTLRIVRLATVGWSMTSPIRVLKISLQTISAERVSSLPTGYIYQLYCKITNMFCSAQVPRREFLQEQANRGTDQTACSPQRMHVDTNSTCLGCVSGIHCYSRDNQGRPFGRKLEFSSH